MLEFLQMRFVPKLEFAIPAIILAFFLIDIASHFMPMEWISFRAYDPAMLYPAENAPFGANRCYHKAHVFGDLASICNQPTYRQDREQTFSTDGLGYHNLPQAALGNAPDVMVFGDSYIAFGGDRDENTFASQLARASGLKVYNAGGYYPTPDHILWLADKLKMKKGLIVFEVSERMGQPPPRLDMPLGIVEKLCMHVPARQREGVSEVLHAVRSYFVSYSSYSPLAVVCSKIHRQLENDVVFPNLSAKNIVIRKLPSGQPMLFLEEELTNPDRSLHKDLAIKFFSPLQDELRQKGFIFAVLLVPNKYTVYAPLLEHDPNDRDKTTAYEPTYFQFLKELFSTHKIACLDLTPYLQVQAGEYLKRNELIYWADDTHWNELGIKLGAEEFDRYIKQLQVQKQ